MAKKKDIEARHAKRLAEGWRLIGWRLYWDARPVDAPNSAYQEPEYVQIGGRYFQQFGNSSRNVAPLAPAKRRPYQRSAHLFKSDVSKARELTTAELAAVEQDVNRIRSLYAHRLCQYDKCDEYHVTRWLLTRWYGRPRRKAAP